jgi:hypothetical protein
MSKKGKPAKSGRSTGWVVLVLALAVSNAATLYYFMYLDNSVPPSDSPLGLAEVLGPENATYIGQVVTLLGFHIVAAGYHMLVSDPMLYFNNSLSAGNHVLVTGAISPSFDASVGKEVTVKGQLQVYDSSHGTKQLTYQSFTEITHETMYPGPYRDVIANPYVQFENISMKVDPSADKYAILYAGGIDPERAYYRFWNDIIYLYFILQMYGYKSENIYVIYKDGVGEDPYTPVNYPATHNSLNTVFSILSGKMGLRDSLFFFTGNHGGEGGISVWDSMDPAGALTHAQVANWLDSITCHHMIIVMNQCESGKFIQYISSANRVIITACRGDESSLSCDTEGCWDEFTFHFMCALTSYDWSNPTHTVDADFNGDYSISMREAFIWAAAFDSRPETPCYNDNGNGYAYSGVQVYYGSGPWLGDVVHL